MAYSGDTYGGNQGQGGAGEAGQGYGEAGTLAFRYRLVGYKWTWENKTGDPRLWTGHGEEYDIRSVDYVFGSAQDALDAGKVEGDADTSIVRVFAEPNTAGFNGLQYTYSDRLTAATNAAAVEGNEAYEIWKTTGDLGLHDDTPGKIPWGPLVLLIIVVGIGIVFIDWMTKAKGKTSMEVPK